jgi:two-component system LytT family sensor kinase
VDGRDLSVSGVSTERHDSSPPRLAYVAVAVVCLAMGAISYLETRHVAITHGTPVAWQPILLSTTPRWLFLAAVLPCVLWLANKFPPAPARTTSIAVHVGAFLAISFAQAGVDSWSLGVDAPMVVVMFGRTARVMRAWYNTMPTMVSMYGAVLFAAWGMAEARERQRRTLRAAQLETQLQGARLASLRAQLQPHFLYNTLNGIAALVADVKPARAVEAIEQLAELLHASLRDDARQDVTVAEEVTLAERYLALQGMRFADRLRYEVRVDAAVADSLVPVLILQPIVENAVVHGLDAGQETLAVQIRVQSSESGVELRVENDGPVVDLETPRPGGHGVGIAATRARLITAFGDDASLTLAPREGGGTVVRMLVPLRLAPKPANEPAMAAAR